MVEGGGLLNRCTVKSRTEGSNPSLSAISHFMLRVGRFLYFFRCEAGQNVFVLIRERTDTSAPLRSRSIPSDASWLYLALN